MGKSLQHAVIVLAAGASRRLGTAKQLLILDGESLINRTIRIAQATEPAQTIVVLGARADEIALTVTHQTIDYVHCADWEAGMSASLKRGIQKVNSECEGALVLLCDQPTLSASHLDALLNAWYRQPDRAVASAYANTVGVPAMLPRSWFVRLSHVLGDQGARELLRRDPTVLRVESPRLEHDVDSPQDLRKNT